MFSMLRRVHMQEGARQKPAVVEKFDFEKFRLFNPASKSRQVKFRAISESRNVQTHIAAHCTICAIDSAHYLEAARTQARECVIQSEASESMLRQSMLSAE